MRKPKASTVLKPRGQFGGRDKGCKAHRRLYRLPPWQRDGYQSELHYLAARRTAEMINALGEPEHPLHLQSRLAADQKLLDISTIQPLSIDFTVKVAS